MDVTRLKKVVLGAEATESELRELLLEALMEICRLQAQPTAAKASPKKKMPDAAQMAAREKFVLAYVKDNPTASLRSVAKAAKAAGYEGTEGVTVARILKKNSEK